MKSQELLTSIKKLPDTPGVYFFRGKGDTQENDILYIGKATSLRDRVRSYFSNDLFENRGPKLVKMLEECSSITYEQTDSVLEALLLEAHLIKKYQPLYNTKEKDDKSFYYVIITKEDFPRVVMVRGRDILISALSGKHTDKKIPYTISHSFGPFPSGTTLREALHLIRKIFPYRDKCVPQQELKDPAKARPCFNYQIGLCPGICVSAIEKEEYFKTIKHIIHFFQGEKKMVIKELEKEMKLFAKKQNFEHATLIKKQMFALTHIHDVSLIKEDSWDKKTNTAFRIESYDIAHMSGDNVVGVMTVVEDGEIKKSDYRKFKIKENPGVNDTKALQEIITRRLAHTEWRMPDLIVVDGGIAQKRAVERVLREKKVGIAVVSVVKDERHKPKDILGEKTYRAYEKEILLSNAEAHRYAILFHKTLRNKKLFA